MGYFLRERFIGVSWVFRAFGAQGLQYTPAGLQTIMTSALGFRDFGLAGLGARKFLCLLPVDGRFIDYWIFHRAGPCLCSEGVRDCSGLMLPAQWDLTSRVWRARRPSARRCGRF